MIFKVYLWFKVTYFTINTSEPEKKLLSRLRKDCAAASSIRAKTLTLRSILLVKQMRYSDTPQLLGLGQHCLSRWTQCASAIPVTSNKCLLDCWKSDSREQQQCNVPEFQVNCSVISFKAGIFSWIQEDILLRFSSLSHKQKSQGS